MDLSAPLGQLEAPDEPHKPGPYQEELIFRYLSTGVYERIKSSKTTFNTVSGAMKIQSPKKLRPDYLHVAAMDWTEFFAGVKPNVFPQPQLDSAVVTTAVAIASRTLHLRKYGVGHGWTWESIWPLEEWDISEIFQGQVLEVDSGISMEEAFKRIDDLAVRLQRDVRAAEDPLSEPEEGEVQDKHLEWLARRLVLRMSASELFGFYEDNEPHYPDSKHNIDKYTRQAARRMDLTLPSLRSSRQ